MSPREPASSQGWEALAADPLPFLLEACRPSVLWRALVELVGRPVCAPAVVRARGGASAAGPVSALLEHLLPDGTWAVRTAPWMRYSGPGWRLVAAAQLGADPEDPRIQAAGRRLLDGLGGEGGVAPADGVEPLPCLTARVVEAMARLGLDRTARAEEAVAWLESASPAPDGGWRCRVPAHRGPSGCRVAAVAVLEAAGAGGRRVRARLRDRASEALAAQPLRSFHAGAPNLLRTDAVEAVHGLALAGCDWSDAYRPMLVRVQGMQSDLARWPAAPAHPSLPLGEPASGGLSAWVTLRAVVALLRFSVEAGLPRRFPQRA